MEQENEQKPEETVESTTEVSEEVKTEEVAEERPEINYKAELARKNAEIERLRNEAASRQVEPQKRDPNDIRTWPDHELRMLKKDPQFAQYHDQADDILMERKVIALDAKRRESENRVKADAELLQQYPDVKDAGSELSMKMAEMMEKYDLSKTPAGRLVAAKLASTELKKGQSTSKTVAQKKEQDRVASLKANMVDGDRAKPTQDTPKDLEVKRKDLSERLMYGKGQSQQDALGEVLKDRLGGPDSFFNRNKK